MVRWRKANGAFLDSWLSGKVKGLDGKGRRWKIVRDLGWGGDDIFKEDDMEGKDEDDGAKEVEVED